MANSSPTVKQSNYKIAEDMPINENHKLLYFCSAWSGGIVEHAHEQAEALEKRGVRVTFLTSPAYTKTDSASYELRKTLKTAGAFKSSLTLLRKSVLAIQILQNYSALADIIEKEGFQYVLLACYTEYLAPLWFLPLSRLAQQGVKFGAVVLDPVRGYVVGPLWWHRWSIACAYSFLQEAFVHEAIELDTVKPMPNLHTTVIPNGPYNCSPPQQSREEVRRQLQIPDEAKVLLSFGHIRDGKNLDLVLQAISKSSDKLYLVIAGSVSSEGQRPVKFYQNLAADLGIAEQCRWLIEFIPESQVGNLFNACDAIVITYSVNFQSASGVLSTAAAYRRVCIASCGQGHLQTMVRRYGLGVWVEPDSWEAIKMGIELWLQGLDSPRWEDYDQENSWDKSAEIVCQRFWGG